MHLSCSKLNRTNGTQQQSGGLEPPSHTGSRLPNPSIPWFLFSHQKKTVCVEQHPPSATHSSTSFRGLSSPKRLVYPSNEQAVQVFWKMQEVLWPASQHNTGTIQNKAKWCLKSLIPLARICLLLTRLWWCFSLLHEWFFIFNGSRGALMPPLQCEHKVQ